MRVVPSAHLRCRAPGGRRRCASCEREPARRACRSCCRARGLCAGSGTWRRRGRERALPWASFRCATSRGTRGPGRSRARGPAASCRLRRSGSRTGRGERARPRAGGSPRSPRRPSGRASSTGAGDASETCAGSPVSFGGAAADVEQGDRAKPTPLPSPRTHLADTRRKPSSSPARSPSRLRERSTSLRAGRRPSAATSVSPSRSEMPMFERLTTSRSEKFMICTLRSCTVAGSICEVCAGGCAR